MAWNFKQIAVLILLLSIVTPVHAGLSNYTDGNGKDFNDVFKPNAEQSWNSLPASVQSILIWIIGIVFIGLVVVAIISLFGHGMLAQVAQKKGDVAGRTTNLQNAALAIVILIIAIVGVVLIRFVVT